MSWERWTGHRNTEAIVSIAPSGYLAISQAAVRRFRLAEATHVELHFDHTEHLVGMGFCQGGGRGRRKLQIRGGARSLYAKAFLYWAGVDRRKRRRYTPQWNDGLGLLLIGPVTMVAGMEGSE